MAGITNPPRVPLYCHEDKSILPQSNHFGQHKSSDQYDKNDLPMPRHAKKHTPIGEPGYSAPLIDKVDRWGNGFVAIEFGVPKDMKFDRGRLPYPPHALSAPTTTPWTEEAARAKLVPLAPLPNPFEPVSAPPSALEIAKIFSESSVDAVEKAWWKSHFGALSQLTIIGSMRALSPDELRTKDHVTRAIYDKAGKAPPLSFVMPPLPPIVPPPPPRIPPGPPPIIPLARIPPGPPARVRIPPGPPPIIPLARIPPGPPARVRIPPGPPPIIPLARIPPGPPPIIPLARIPPGPPARVIIPPVQPPPKNPQKVYIEELPPQEWKEKPDERVVYERNPQSDKVDAIYNLSKVYKDVLATDFKNSDDWKVWREVIKIIDPKTYATGQDKKPYSLIKLYKPWKAEKEDAASWLMRLLTKTSNVRPLLAYLADPDYFEDVARNPDIIKEVARESAKGNFFYHPGLTLSSSKPQTPRQGTRRAIA